MSNFRQFFWYEVRYLPLLISLSMFSKINDTPAGTGQLELVYRVFLFAETEIPNSVLRYPQNNDITKSL